MRVSIILILLAAYHSVLDLQAVTNHLTVTLT